MEWTKRICTKCNNVKNSKQICTICGNEEKTSINILRSEKYMDDENNLNYDDYRFILQDPKNKRKTFENNICPICQNDVYSILLDRHQKERYFCNKCGKELF